MNITSPAQPQDFWVPSSPSFSTYSISIQINKGPYYKVKSFGEHISSFTSFVLVALFIDFTWNATEWAMWFTVISISKKKKINNYKNNINKFFPYPYNFIIKIELDN